MYIQVLQSSTNPGSDKRAEYTQVKVVWARMYPGSDSKSRIYPGSGGRAEYFQDQLGLDKYYIQG